MKMRPEKTTNRKRILLFSFLFALVFFLVSCGNMLNPSVTPVVTPETSVPPPGKGLMRLHLLDGERTLRPAGVDNLALVFFKLEFFSESGTHAPLTGGTFTGFSGDIELEAGSWTISLSGYSDAQGTALEAQGQAVVEITAGRTSSAVISLEPAGTGVFDYAALRASLEGKNLSRAALALFSLRDNSVQTVDLLDAGGNGTLNLSAGYYRLAIDLYQNNGAANATETAHILNERTTAAPYVFADFTFIPADFLDTQSSGLAAALTAVSAAATDGANFIINLAADEEDFAPATLSYNGNRVTITLMGRGAGKNRVKLGGEGSLFTIDSGVTLILKDVALEGRALGFDKYDHLVWDVDGNLIISGGGEYKPVDFGNTAALITVNGGTLILENGGSVRGNLRHSYSGSYIFGGGIEVNGPGVCVLNGGEVTENFCVTLESSGYGGGIGVSATTGKITFNSGLISKNGASDVGSGIYSRGDVVMNGGFVSENIYSGGVYIGPISAFTMNGGTISKHEGWDGGGIHLDSGVRFTMNGGTISKNEGKGGGGIYCADNTVVEIKGGAIRDNYSREWGGGICSGRDSDSMTGSVPPEITISGGVISGNRSGSYGGGAIGIITMTGGLITNNEAGSGGGVFGTLTLRDGEISGNKAVIGGGMSGDITMTGGKIIHNIATTTASNTFSYGGGISGYGVISGGEISGNQVLATGFALGGGIYISEGTLTLQTGTLVKDNYVSGRGGGVYVVNGSTLNIEGGVITHNEATSDGAGVYIVDGGFNMTDGEISENKGWDGIYAISDHGDSLPTLSLNISGGSIKGNEGNGISIYYGGDLTMTGGTISGHRRYGIIFLGPVDIQFDGGEISGNSRGGIYTFSESSTTMTGGVIKNNGGSGIRTEGPLIISGGEISGNIVDDYDENGGGVYVTGSTGSFTLTGGVIKNNYAPKSGGGVYASGITVFMRGGEISGNNAGEKGGGIFVSAGNAGSFTKSPAQGSNTSGIIYGNDAGTALRNSAPEGAALYWNNQSKGRNATIGAEDALVLPEPEDGGYAWE
jgi:hypothetical protein